jgi:hypothetical protein
MKFHFLLFTLFLPAIFFSALGQELKKTADSTFSFSVVAKDMKVVSPIFDEPISSVNEDGKTYFVRNNMRRNKFTNSKNALPKGGDPLVKNNKASHPNKAPIVNWDGLSSSQSGGGSPPDPSGAVGINHYVQMVNTSYRVYDKSGNPITSPASLGSLLGGVNAGDPIVMYDKFADRWFLSQFSYQNELIVAVSQTPDPTGAYYLYTFSLSSFPDYPKYSVWSDGYYITSNKPNDNAFVMERDKMIAGDPSAQIIGFTIPNLSTPGFFSVLPANASSSLPAPGTPNYLFYFQDDAWSGGTDHLKIWEVNVDWLTPNNSSISSPQSLPVSPFDSEFDEINWFDITQPGTNAKIDAVPGALMYMGHYRSFNNYNAIALNHTVDVNGANLAGIRWYELRQTGTGPWTLYQEGTFNPDGENRWMGSIAMDYQGNIGLAYSVSGATTYPSIKYTGRYVNDPLGQMTLNEEVIVNGTSSQTNSQRFGDYAQMTIDPTDDATFWFTGEYISSEWKTRIASFKIANDSDNDIGVSGVYSPIDGTLTSSEAITIEVSNYGLNDQSNFPVSYQINGGGLITETYTGTLTSGSNTTYTFNTTADFSSIGSYTIKSYTDLFNDQFYNNDTLFYNVKHLGNDDVGVTAITAPASSSTLGNNEVVTVSLKNFGVLTQSNFPISYQIDNGQVVSETFTGSLAPNTSASFSFSTTADLSSLGLYTIKAFTSLLNDTDILNDTSFMEVEHEVCLPMANCDLLDGFIKIELSNLINNSACSPNGYGDYTSETINLERSVTYDLKVQSGYADQHGTVWIDFNDNFTFENSEKLLSNILFGTSIDTFSLVIPNNVNIGEHLMRFRANYNADIDDGCIDVSYGETEDYTANVIAFSAVNEKYKGVELKVILNENKQLMIELTNSSEEVQLEITNSIGQQIVTGNFNANSSYKVDVSVCAPGYYLVRVSNKNRSKIRKIWIQ